MDRKTEDFLEIHTKKISKIGGLSLFEKKPSCPPLCKQQKAPFLVKGAIGSGYDISLHNITVF
jgi:hypothetical protein